ncbi:MULTISPECIES: hypothetical protein [unclassified Rhodococcus (in: high G+C Gram-positive bacteria)]|uniref:hypothetical protein n=1 Tax=unclassified Rhodococcus (in: high G+C Gram-positive bacteria) TaxID=192944 RepID=UPI00215B9222|nr:MULTISPECIES: hypothetical protein [unclassified Rhodococcus (in: high G+C Gram-positive bacteria)]
MIAHHAGGIPLHNSPLHNTAGPSRSTQSSGRKIATLIALVAGFSAAFVLAPGMLTSRPGDGYAGEGELVETVRAAFVEYWSSGAQAFSPSLESAVDYWLRYHVAKAVIAVILLTVLFALGRMLKASFVNAGPLTTGKKLAFVSAGGLVALLALFSSVLVMANVQGVVAPFSSLISMLPVAQTDGALSETVGQVRQQLAQSTGTGNQQSPALELMISDFARYHLAMAVIALIAAAISLAVAVVVWARFARTARSDRRTRFMSGSIGLLTALFTLGLIVVGVANMGTAADPALALAAFFDGGL